MPMPCEPAMSPRATARDLLAPETKTCGFTVRRTEEIDELDADAYVLTHDASGARLLYLACDDENKAFAIAFKTPPADDTGVFHILEHSVLCGSEKFPVKEPFVDLIKSSMQTFLNAMTYPDKTVYPVASTNEQDLLNLMDVYMDAVMRPAVYVKPTIFQQEGWHLELAGEGDDDTAPMGEAAGATPGAAPMGLRYNGVVFNEMKGALSDPMDVLDNAINRELFPDTAYACESGGNPRSIPQLTYEAFLDAHARHYTLDNCYIVLYGDFPDIRRELGFLDEGYLADAAREQTRAWRSRAHGGAGTPNRLGHQEPHRAEYRCIEMATAPENALAGLAYVLGDAVDTRRIIAADVLFEALLGSNEAPVKKAVMAAGIGGNVLSYTSSSCAQPYEMIILQGARPEAAQSFRRIVEETSAELVQSGIPRDRLEAVISNNEYALRQRDYGTADGVVLACEALSTWLYAEDDAETRAATRAITYADTFRWLREQLEGDFFERLLSELVLESGHMALVELVPVDEEEAGAAAEERAELEELASRMTEADRKRVATQVEELRAAQEADDSPEAKATLPRLRVSDIGTARPEPPVELDRKAPVPCLKHPLETHRIAYALTYFDLSHVSFAELPYVKVLCLVLRQLATRSHTAAELDTLIAADLGFLKFGVNVYQRENWKLARPMLVAAAGALSEKVEALANLPREVWSETVFEDTDRMRDVLTQMRIAMEQSFITAGHQAAMGRAASYVLPAGVIAEQLSGVDFYLFLKDLVEHFDERAGELCEKLRELQARIFTSTGTVASFTGSEDDYRRYWAAAGDLGLAARTVPAKELYVPFPEDRHEAFVIPSDVSYTAQASDARVLGIATDGTWSVAANALSYDYLWNEIRVKGGAYGCGFRSTSGRSLTFYTYRDPAIDPSLARIAAAGDWLGAFDPTPEAFEGFIVSTVSALDAPVKPYAATIRRNTEFFSERPAGFRQRLRDEVLATTPEDLRAIGEQVTRVAAEAPACTFAGRSAIEASDADWNVVELLG